MTALIRLVVAEKPSVARDIARVLGAARRGNGFLSGNGYVVTWALGHLVHFAEPDEYGPPWKGRWSFQQLPMLPDSWKLVTTPASRKQFAVVRDLLNDPDTGEIICATDAGREGELIFRLIHQHARCRKPFRRLWIASLTDRAIRRGLDNLEASSAFDGLAAAARARAQADWLVGLNLTRAYTVHNQELCTIGRVQTPTLALIVQREEEIACFEKTYYYELVADMEEGFRARYTEDGQTRISPRERAEELYRKLRGHQTGRVTGIEKKIKKRGPPPLYDLTGLQRDANQRFGFTASRTLEYAQTLYERHKLITYPRTESRHIPPDLVPRLPAILEKLDHPQAPAARERMRAGHRLGRAYVDQTKLTDHHAILPTGQAPPEALSPALRKIYDLVVGRFVAIFLPEHVVEVTEASLDIGGACFVARGAVVLQQGWKVVEPPRGAAPGEQEEEPPLPGLAEGQLVRVTSMEVEEKETHPPRRYTDATLLNAMKSAGRHIEDEELAGAMKDSGLGTPATRAETIEKLIRAEYVQRRNKALAPTEKGRALIGVVDGPLKSPELTAQWEKQLKEIEEGRLAADRFYESIVELVRSVVSRVPTGPALPPEARTGAARSGGRGRSQQGTPPGNLGSCPVCGQGTVIETARAYGCSRDKDGCGLTIWKEVAGKKLTAKQVQDLLVKGRTARISGFSSKAGKRFAARLRLDEQSRIAFEFDNSPKRSTRSGRRSGRRSG